MKKLNQKGISAIGLVLTISVVFAILIASSAHSAQQYFEAYRKMRIRLDGEQLVEDIAMSLRKEYERISLVSFSDDPTLPHKNPFTLEDFTAALKAGTISVVIDNPDSPYYKKQIQIEPNQVETFHVVDFRVNEIPHLLFDKQFYQYAALGFLKTLEESLMAQAHADMTDRSLPDLPNTLPSINVQYDNSVADDFDKRYFFRCNEGNLWLEYDCITVRVCAKPTTSSCSASEMITASYAFFRNPKTSLDN